MRRFILKNNISRFQALLATEADDSGRRTLEGLLLEAERELAKLNAEQYGARDGPAPRLAHEARWDAPEMAAFRREFEASPKMLMILDHGPGLHIVDVNPIFEAVSGYKRADLVGRDLFDAFPDNPQDAGATGIRNLYDSLRMVVETGQPHAMPVQRYDVMNGDGEFVQRWWRPVNAPLFDEQHRLIYLMQSVDEVTELVRYGEAPAA